MINISDMIYILLIDSFNTFKASLDQNSSVYVTISEGWSPRAMWI